MSNFGGGAGGGGAYTANYGGAGQCQKCFGMGYVGGASGVGMLYCDCQIGQRKRHEEQAIAAGSATWKAILAAKQQAAETSPK